MPAIPQVFTIVHSTITKPLIGCTIPAMSNAQATPIPVDKIKDLASAIKKVLEDAEKQIRKNKPDIISGEVRDFLKIHNSYKTESPSGKKIEQKTIGGRKTYYTSEQELYK